MGSRLENWERKINSKPVLSPKIIAQLISPYIQISETTKLVETMATLYPTEINPKRKTTITDIATSDKHWKEALY